MRHPPVARNAFAHPFPPRADVELSKLAVTERDQVTLRKNVRAHRGRQPGGGIDLEKHPDGVVTRRAERPASDIDGYVGLLSGRPAAVPD